MNEKKESVKNERLIEDEKRHFPNISIKLTHILLFCNKRTGKSC